MNGRALRDRYAVRQRRADIQRERAGRDRHRFGRRASVVQRKAPRTDLGERKGGARSR